LRYAKLDCIRRTDDFDQMHDDFVKVRCSLQVIISKA
jgi:hypothetical protein